MWHTQQHRGWTALTDCSGGLLWLSPVSHGKKEEIKGGSETALNATPFASCKMFVPLQGAACPYEVCIHDIFKALNKAGVPFTWAVLKIQCNWGFLRMDHTWTFATNDLIFPQLNESYWCVLCILDIACTMWKFYINKPSDFGLTIRPRAVSRLQFIVTWVNRTLDYFARLEALGPSIG